MATQKIPKSINELLKQGKENGFLVIDVILFVYPQPELHIEDVDELFSQTIEQNIDIFENVSTREEEEAKKSLEELEAELKNLINLKQGESLDPIKMYL